MRLWVLLKDVLLTGTGVVIIYLQAFSLHPDGLVLGTGLALTVPSIAEHVKALLPSSGGGPSSPSSPPPGSPRPSPGSSPPPEVTHE